MKRFESGRAFSRWQRIGYSSVMAGLVPAIHAFLIKKQVVDARHKAGHDDG
jgi:hypothetical protein